MVRQDGRGVFDGEVIVADVASGEVLGLAGAGAAMWLAALDASTEAEALDRLDAAFGVERDRLSADWDDFVAALLRRGLLQRS